MSVAYGLSGPALVRWHDVHKAILSRFPWLLSEEFELGCTRIRIWSHHTPGDCANTAKKGEHCFLIGSPANRCSWELLIDSPATELDRALQLEGRWALLRVDADGERWFLCNDWAGAVPIFFAPTENGGVMSSLEPVVTNVAGLTPRHFSKRGLVELLLLGHFLSTDTLYEPMQVLPPDSFGIWNQGKVQKLRRLWSVRPSEAPKMGREVIVTRLHELTVECISQSLCTEERAPVLVTLSSGMDSRLIAYAAAESGFPVEAYTYGPQGWTEPYYGRKIAKSLGIPWQRVPLGVDYLKDYTGRWLQWFGSSLHTHGMYQFPFLEQIKGRRGVIPNGFYGNNMAGGDHPNDCLFQPRKGLFERYCGYGTYWDRESLAQLLDFDPNPYFSEMEALLQEQIRLVQDWPEYQQMNCIDMWNRQARYASYQPAMYSYYGLERSPFMQRDYARFCMSLPAELLRKRKLQIEMLKRYRPAEFAIGGSFRPRKGFERKWHGLRYRIADKLPAGLRPILGVTSVFRLGLDCASHSEWDAFPCIPRTLPDVDPLRTKPIIEAVKSAINGSRKDLLRVMAVQPVIHALISEM